MCLLSTWPQITMAIVLSLCLTAIDVAADHKGRVLDAEFATKIGGSTHDAVHEESEAVQRRSSTLSAP